MYDVIVVGARCAGAPLAMRLAQKGHKVLLVDRSTFPSDIPHGHFIHRQGPRYLHQWGLLDRIISTNCPAATTFTTDFGDFPLVGRDLTTNGIAMGYAPRRSVLDEILVKAAVDAGVELREGVVIEGFQADGDRITGIRGRDKRTGMPIIEQATIVIGADGRNSLLAKTVEAPIYAAHPAVSFYYFSYWSGISATGAELYSRNKNAVFAFPTNDNLFAVFVSWPSAELSTVRGDVERQFWTVLDRIPEFAARVRNGHREEKFRGAVDLPNYFRKPWGPGWALVGDAGCHKDPYLALGIGDAFRDAEALAIAVDSGLSGNRLFDEALKDYEHRRNEAGMPDYQENLHFAQFRPIPPQAYQLRAALRGQQVATNQYFMAREGIIPAAAFFDPQNIQRILAGATSS